MMLNCKIILCAKGAFLLEKKEISWLYTSTDLSCYFIYSFIYFQSRFVIVMEEKSFFFKVHSHIQAYCK